MSSEIFSDDQLAQGTSNFWCSFASGFDVDANSVCWSQRFGGEDLLCGAWFTSRERRARSCWTRGNKLPQESLRQSALICWNSWSIAPISLVGATSQGLRNNLPSPFALLSHKSLCLKRKCSSTSAAETQIMSEDLAEVEWIRGLFEELTNPNFSIVERAASSRNRGLLIAARSSDDEVRFPKVLSIGDAKSLYDHLRTETSGGANDRRTAITIQIIRASMDTQGATVRWVDHSGMYADAMTEKNCNVPLLQMLMRSKTRVDPVTQAVMDA